jgi:hypothetical protein
MGLRDGIGVTGFGPRATLRPILISQRVPLIEFAIVESS